LAHPKTNVQAAVIPPTATSQVQVVPKRLKSLNAVTPRPSNHCYARKNTRVRKSERFNWAETRGVNEEQLIENLPEDLQRDIRQHLFKFIKEVRIFTLMDDDILDAICERLRQKLYIEGSQILRCGSAIEKMFFIVRGKLEVTWEESGYSVPLSEGDVFGEELLTWCLEQTSVDRDVRKIRSTGHRLFSSRTVTCLSNVEAFSLHVNDLEEVTALFARLLRNPRVQRALRYQSPYWRALAATHIQVAWRYRKRRQSARLNSSSMEGLTILNPILDPKKLMTV
ncbi:putative cyclic nucleotide-gated ion channel 20, partial [Nymphaea thermarum]